MTPEPILSPLCAELSIAARRRYRAGRIPRPVALIAAAALFGSGATAALAITGAFDRDQPGRAYPQTPPEPGLRYTTRPIVLARYARGGGSQFQLVGYRYARRGSTVPAQVCLDVLLLPEGTSHGCLAPRGHLQGRTGDTYEGATTATTTRVLVTYRTVSGASGQRSAALMRAEDPRTLRLTGIAAPFVIWRATLPRNAEDVTASGYTPQGRHWSAKWPPRR